MKNVQVYWVILIIVLIAVAAGFLYTYENQRIETMERFGDYGEPQSSDDYSYENEYIPEEYVGDSKPSWKFREALARASELDPGIIVTSGQMSEPTLILDLLESEVEFMFLRDEIQDYLKITDEEEMQELWISLIQQGMVGEWETILEEQRIEKNI